MSNSRPQQQPSRPPYSPRDSGPSYNQVLEEIRSAGMLETVTSVEVSPNAGNEYLCVIKAEVVMPPLREGDPFRKYTGMGAAYPRKNGAGVIHGVSNPSFYMHVAESRAKKRAWMDALGRGDGLEENVRSEVFAERARNVVPALPVPKVLANPEGKVSEEVAVRLSTLTGLAIETCRDYTRQQAVDVFNKAKTNGTGE